LRNECGFEKAIRFGIEEGFRYYKMGVHCLTQEYFPKPFPSESELDNMPVKELKSLLNSQGIDYSDCVEKIDLIKKAKKASSSSKV
jgi:hypothetical protein